MFHPDEESSGLGGTDIYGICLRIIIIWISTFFPPRFYSFSAKMWTDECEYYYIATYELLDCMSIIDTI